MSRRRCIALKNLARPSEEASDTVRSLRRLQPRADRTFGAAHINHERGEGREG